MARLAVAVDIRRPVPEVWAFVTDLKNSPRWTRSGSELRQTSAGPMGVGATIESTRRVLGRDITSQRLRVTTYEPGHAISLVGEIPILRRAEMPLVFEPIEGGTRVTRTSELEPGPVLRFLLPVLLPMLTSVQNTEMAQYQARGGISALIRRRAGSKAEGAARPSVLFPPLGHVGIIGAEPGAALGGLLTSERRLARFPTNTMTTSCRLRHDGLS